MTNTITTSQISELHEALEDELDMGLDLDKVRVAVERAGLTWDRSCPHTELSKITYEDPPWEYICTTSGHPHCHEKFKTLAMSGDQVPIEELDLTVRAYNVLKREGVSTVGELCDRSYDDLLDMRNMGVNAVADIEQRLGTINRTLAAKRGLEFQR